MAFSATRMLMAASGVSSGPPPYSANATHFSTSPSDQYMTISGSSLGTYSTGILSFWINLTGFDSVFTNVIRNNTNTTVNVRITNAGSVSILIYDTSSQTNSLTITSNTTLSTSTWYNILCSWNSSTGVMTLYINNVVDTATPSFSGSFTTQWSDTQYIISLSSNATVINGCLSELYLAANQFIDFTVSGNRAKFISGGAPVSLGSNGQTPTGTSPSFYWPALYSNLSNLGAVGGTFTVFNGPLTACGSAP